MSRFTLVLCTLVLVAFGGRTAVAVEAASQSMDEQMARLLPKGAAIVAYTPSMSKLTSELTDIVKQFDEQAAGMLMFMGPQSLLSMQLNTKQKIRSDMPAAIALTPGASLEDTPAMTVIFAVTGATADNVKANSKDMKLVFLEGTDWVAMTTGASYEAAEAGARTSAVATGLLPGILSVSIDQALFRTKYGDALQQQLYEGLSAGSAPKDTGDSDQAIVDLNKTIATKLADGFDRWDLGLNLDPTRPGWTIQYTPSSPDCLMQPSPELVAVGSHLATELPMQSVVSKDLILDVISLMKLFIPVESKDVQSSLRAYVGHFEQFLDQVSGGMGVSMGMDGAGMSVVKAMRVKDVAKALSAVDGMMDFINGAKWGITSESIPVTVGASTSRAYRIKFDVEQMKKAFSTEFDMSQSAANTFTGSLMQADAHVGELLSAMQGPDGMIVRFISKDDWMAVVIGDAKLLGTARRALAMANGGNAPLDLALKSAGGSPVMGMSVDVRSYMIGLGKFLTTHPKLSTTPLAEGPNAIMAKLPSSPKAMIYTAASTSDGATRFTVELDLKGLAAFNKDMLALTAEQEKQAEAARKAAEKKKDEQGGTP